MEFAEHKFQILETDAGLWHEQEIPRGPALVPMEPYEQHLQHLPMMIGDEVQVLQQQRCRDGVDYDPKAYVPDCGKRGNESRLLMRVATSVDELDLVVIHRARLEGCHRTNRLPGTNLRNQKA